MNKNLAIITGGVKRIGGEVAINLAKKGFDIVVTYNKSESEAINFSKDISNKFGVACHIYQCDLSDLQNTKKLAQDLFKNHPNCNLLINNASIFSKSKFLQTDILELEKNMNVHLNSPLILSHAFALNSQKNNLANSQIINLIDKNISRYETSYFHYLLSKKSLSEATKMLSLQLAPNIRVNAIAPGYILEPIDNEQIDEKKKESIINKIPLQRKGNVKNIVMSVDFLIENDFVNGQILSIDGGASLNHAG